MAQDGLNRVGPTRDPHQTIGVYDAGGDTELWGNFGEAEYLFCGTKTKCPGFAARLGPEWWCRLCPCGMAETERGAMTLADMKSSVLLTLLTVFAAGWLALYFIMANRVTAAEATAITLNGQQSAALQSINNQLSTMNRTLGRLEQLPQKMDAIDDKLDRLIESLAELKSVSHTHTPRTE